jgi:hypothetical protein
MFLHPSLPHLLAPVAIRNVTPIAFLVHRNSCCGYISYECRILCKISTTMPHHTPGMIFFSMHFVINDGAASTKPQWLCCSAWAQPIVSIDAATFNAKVRKHKIPIYCWRRSKHAAQFASAFWLMSQVSSSLLKAFEVPHHGLVNLIILLGTSGWFLQWMCQICEHCITSQFLIF